MATNVSHTPTLPERQTTRHHWTAPGDTEALTSAVGLAWDSGRAPGGPLSQRAAALRWEVVGPRLLEAYR